ncbi:hypothetical protein Clacol_005584 [Clathrus columnatus]|uniref:EF-hand domain-containing protein n=1 Tax=Clathrus columnatus TaxID=1419009 RepID=A0AAV5ACN1_9AGAM|nr:hypothetical protein Clacol_005584 [Clathrus columnatus]
MTEKDFEAGLSNLQGNETPGKPSTLPEYQRDDEGLTQSSSSESSTNSSDEFWEDAAKEAGEVKVFHDTRAKRGRWLYLSFMRLYRPFRIFLVSMVVAGVLITPYIVVKVSFPNSRPFPHVRAWSLWFTVSWACMTIMSILVDTLPRVIVYFFLTLTGKPPDRLTTELEAIVAWLKFALYSSIFWIALSIMRAFLRPPGDYWIIINRVAGTLFAATMVLLIEKCFLHFVAIQFHKKALADRLLENKLALKALDRLSAAQSPSTKRKSFGRRKTGKTASAPISQDPSYEVLTEIANSSQQQPPSGHRLDDAIIDVATKDAKRSRRKRRAIASMILDQVGDVISSLALKDSNFHRRGMGSVHSARLLARKVFAALSDAYPPRNLVVSDFYPYFPSREEAEIAFDLIDQDGNGDISRREMREAVQRIYRERKALSSSLKDVGNIVAKLDGVLLALALVIMIFVALLIFNRANTLSSLVPLATIVLGFSFIFGHSAQTLFESLIFIFSTHVFDIGDLVMIDDQMLISGQILTVSEFGLFSTTFRRVDGQEIIAPNALLARPQADYGIRWETTTIHVDYNTPLEAVEELRTRLKAYVNANNREWSDLTINIDKMEYQNVIYLNINMQHKSNWQNWGGRWQRRTALMRHLKTLLEELEISYSKPLQPVVLHHQQGQGSPLSPSSPIQLRHAHTMRSPTSPRNPRSPGLDSLGNAGLYSNMDRAFPPTTRVMNGQPD